MQNVKFPSQCDARFRAICADVMTLLKDKGNIISSQVDVIVFISFAFVTALMIFRSTNIIHHTFYSSLSSTMLSRSATNYPH